ncbi:hypothetical protein ACJ41O_009025 [Fusarium nematophilum]
MPLSEDQIRVVIALERIGASLSLAGVTLIFITYWRFKKLRTIPNLFIILASIANVGASIACLIGQDGILGGEESALCQAQAFLLEMFMQSDPWWSLAMAVNVFLVIFHGATTASLKHYLWLYCLVCFGGPFIPAIVLLLARPNNHMIYGDATLWCWIGNDWNALRIYTYYLPIWVCIFLSAVIYFAVGYHVFRLRSQLHNLTFSHSSKDGNDASHLENAQDLDDMNLTSRVQDRQVTVVTEVQVTAVISATSIPPQSSTVASTAGAIPYEYRHAQHQQSSETIVSSRPPPRHPPQPKPLTAEQTRSQAPHFNFSRLRGIDPIKLAYLRTSFIFAISILVTWTPSSIMRVSGLINPNSSSYGVSIATAIVLPLQGVWNTVIYFVTSWSKVKEEYLALMAGPWARRVDYREGSGLDGARAEQRDRFNMGLFERTKRPSSDETSERELTAPVIMSNDNIRVMRGSF